MRLPVILLSVCAVATGADYQAVATSKHIMEGIQKPAMDSLAAMMKAGGPKDDKEWSTAQQNASLLAETAQLLLMGTRPLDQDVWLKTSEKLRAAAMDCAKASEAKDMSAWKPTLAAMGSACRGCHNVHKKKKQE